MREGIPVLLGDVAKVSDSYATQTNIARINGQRASYMAILKNSDASTLAVVDAVRDLLPELQEAAPQGLELKMDFDQSVFVRGAVENVVHEAIISSILVSLMILVFLGSWRNTVVVSISIPLSIAAGMAGLFLTGQTINLMTLGGLALAIGLLVDNATVTIENIHRNQAMGKPLTVAILDGSKEVIQPLTVATLAICIVFFPVLLLTGPARFLFIPLGVTVVLAMLASYVLSFTVVPAFARYLLKDHDHGQPKGMGASAIGSLRPRLRPGARGLRSRIGVVAATPEVRAWLLRAARGGNRNSDPRHRHRLLSQRRHRHHQVARPRPARNEPRKSEKIVAAVEQRIRAIIPAGELRTINSLIGVPFSLNLAFVPSDNISGMDAELLISLNKGHKPSVEYMRAIRAQLPDEFPGSLFYFQTADIVSQVLNFGLSAPIDVQIQESNFTRAYATGQRC